MWSGIPDINNNVPHYIGDKNEKHEKLRESYIRERRSFEIQRF